jgi:hypothetical protein
LQTVLLKIKGDKFTDDVLQLLAELKHTAEDHCIDVSSND